MVGLERRLEDLRHRIQERTTCRRISGPALLGEAAARLGDSSSNHGERELRLGSGQLAPID
jgi:hypothetical protein